MKNKESLKPTEGVESNVVLENEQPVNQENDLSAYYVQRIEDILDYIDNGQDDSFEISEAYELLAEVTESVKNAFLSSNPWMKHLLPNIDNHQLETAAFEALNLPPIDTIRKKIEKSFLDQELSTDDREYYEKKLKERESRLPSVNDIRMPLIPGEDDDIAYDDSGLYPDNMAEKSPALTDEKADLLTLAEQRLAGAIDVGEVPEGERGVNGGFVPRPEFTLQTLESMFGLDLANEDNIKVFVTSGNDETKYYLIDVASLGKDKNNQDYGGRLIRVCNRTGSATFFFDRAILEAVDVDAVNFARFNAYELNKLVKEYPQYGKIFKGFDFKNPTLELRLANEIAKPIKSKRDSEKVENPQVVTRAAETDMTAEGLADKLSEELSEKRGDSVVIAQPSIRHAAKKLGITGEWKLSDRGKTHRYYSKEDCQRIKDEIAPRYDDSLLAPEGWKTASQIGQGLYPPKFKKILESLRSTGAILGKEYYLSNKDGRSTNRRNTKAVHYSPEEIKIILQAYYGEKGPKPRGENKDGVTRRQLVERLGLNNEEFDRLVEDLVAENGDFGNSLMETKLLSDTSHIRYSQELAERINDYFYRQPKTQDKMARLFAISFQDIGKAILSLRRKGELTVRHSRQKISADEQEEIMKELWATADDSKQQQWMDNERSAGAFKHWNIDIKNTL